VLCSQLPAVCRGQSPICWTHIALLISYLALYSPSPSESASAGDAVGGFLWPGAKAMGCCVASAVMGVGAGVYLAQNEATLALTTRLCPPTLLLLAAVALPRSFIAPE